MTRTVYSVVRTPCKCQHRDMLRPSQRHCMSCGGINPQFDMQAYLDENPKLPFGEDCRDGHRSLLGALLEFPDYPCCEHCGFNFLTGKQPTPQAPM